MKNFKSYIKFALIVVIFGATFVSTSHAEIIPSDHLDNYTPLVTITDSEGNKVIDTEQANSLPKYLKAVFQLSIGLAALFAVLMITVGGIEYMTSESLGGKAEGKERIQNALIGLLLAMSAYIILYTVNPRTLDFNFNPEPIGTITPPTDITPANPTPGQTNTPSNTPTNAPGNNPPGNSTSTTPTPDQTRNWYKLDICLNYNQQTTARVLGTYSYQLGNQSGAEAFRACLRAEPTGPTTPTVNASCNRGHYIVCQATTRP